MLDYFISVKTTMLIKNKKNEGLTLIEALLNLIITAAVIMIAFYMYNYYSRYQKADTVSDELKFVYTNMNVFINNSPNKAISDFSLSKSDLLLMGIYPKTVKATATATVSAFGDMHIAYSPGSNGEIYNVIYYSIPGGAICNYIVNAQKEVGWTRVNSLYYNSTYSAAKSAAMCGNSSTVITLTFYAAPYQPTDLNAAP